MSTFETVILETAVPCLGMTKNSFKSQFLVHNATIENRLVYAWPNLMDALALPTIVSNLPAIVPDLPTIVSDLPTVVLDLPTVVFDLPTIVKMIMQAPLALAPLAKALLAQAPLAIFIFF